MYFPWLTGSINHKLEDKFRVSSLSMTIKQSLVLMILVLNNRRKTSSRQQKEVMMTSWIFFLLVWVYYLYLRRNIMIGLSECAWEFSCQQPAFFRMKETREKACRIFSPSILFLAFVLTTIPHFLAAQVPPIKVFFIYANVTRESKSSGLQALECLCNALVVMYNAHSLLQNAPWIHGKACRKSFCKKLIYVSMCFTLARKSSFFVSSL